jgi:hypothetical protein
MASPTPPPVLLTRAAMATVLWPKMDMKNVGTLRLTIAPVKEPQCTGLRLNFGTIFLVVGGSTLPFLHTLNLLAVLCQRIRVRNPGITRTIP